MTLDIALMIAGPTLPPVLKGLHNSMVGLYAWPIVAALLAQFTVVTWWNKVLVSAAWGFGFLVLHCFVAVNLACGRGDCL